MAQCLPWEPPTALLQCLTVLPAESHRPCGQPGQCEIAQPGSPGRSTTTPGGPGIAQENQGVNATRPSASREEQHKQQSFWSTQIYLDHETSAHKQMAKAQPSCVTSLVNAGLREPKPAMHFIQQTYETCTLLTSSVKQSSYGPILCVALPQPQLCCTKHPVTHTLHSHSSLMGGGTGSGMSTHSLWGN